MRFCDVPYVDPSTVSRHWDGGLLPLAQDTLEQEFRCAERFCRGRDALDVGAEDLQMKSVMSTQ